METLLINEIVLDPALINQKKLKGKIKIIQINEIYWKNTQSFVFVA